jgi:2-polyprenyl-3-methyl-5-hydroxy-6-metoxy-1,4-benzoquinol methylase
VTGAALFAGTGGTAALVVETGGQTEGQTEPRSVVNCAVRPAPAAAQVLLPVWGYEFARQFLDRSLPTLLAPGNLPAVARAMPTEFVFLTRQRDEPMIREHPAYRRLAAVCGVRFQAIDDLVMAGNHSTTITLAYAGEIKRSGPAAVDTCFFFLVSDYLLADGSLAAVLARMQAGASAVQVGNFQTVEGESSEWLDRRLDSAEGAVALAPRGLMRWALTCMHPATIANTVNCQVCHNRHTNRLFWRVDNDTLIGRFYLMHMICIRPELTGFVIGASCDYSFVPEMCPSGKVVTITDSDEYLAVEVQPRGHEGHFVAWGPATPRGLAVSLSEWTTARHRLNVRDTIVYHAGELPASLPRVIDEATGFVSQISQGLSPAPQPHRDHPYWRGAIAALEAATRANLAKGSRWALLGRSRRSLASRLYEVVRSVGGRPPEVKRGHPRWADFSRHCAAIEAAIAEIGPCLLIVSAPGTGFADWVAQRAPGAVRFPVSSLLHRLPAGGLLPQGLDGCVLVLNESDLSAAAEIVDALVPSLRPGAPVLVVAFNPRWGDHPTVFGNVVTIHAPLFWRSGLWPEEVIFISARRSCWWLNAGFIQAVRGMFHGSPLLMPLRAMLALVFGTLALGVNSIGFSQASPAARRGGVVSSFFMRLRSNAPAPEIAACVSGRQPDRKVASPPSERPIGAGHSTREPQYNRLLEVHDEVGLTPLGLMTNQVWHEDPRRLTFILARYKFVAKMLSGRHDVAELGCGDAFGTRIVQQEVGQVTVYDFDPVFIGDIEQRQSARWPLTARVHDILDGKLPQQHDAIYSLDVIEHIPVEQEGLYLGNLVASLNDNGVLIIGSPSLESQTYASPQSKIGHINCKTGRELKALLEQYFNTVFLFSMNDEVVHTGFYPMAHYLFALCAGAKRPGAKRPDRAAAAGGEAGGEDDADRHRLR